jgi:hypothetical protein
VETMYHRTELAHEQGRILEAAKNDGDVDLRADELGSSPRRDHLDMDLRVLAHERAEHEGQPARHLGRRRDAHQAARLASCFACQYRCLIEAGDGLPRSFKEGAPGIGEVVHRRPSVMRQETGRRRR